MVSAVVVTLPSMSGVQQSFLAEAFRCCLCSSLTAFNLAAQYSMQLICRQQAPDDRKQHDPQWWVPLCFNSTGDIQPLRGTERWQLASHGLEMLAPQ